VSAPRAYEVHSHDYGRPLIHHGPAQGCHDMPRHKWTRVNARALGLKAAVAMADRCPHHAVVVVWQTNQQVHDNGKAPRVPPHWLPADGVA